MQLEKAGKEISNIEFKKNKVIISFKDETKLELNPETFTHFYLYEGKKLDKDEILKIKEVDDSMVYFSYCLSLLAKKLYSQKEIEEKLKNKKCPYPVIKNLIQKLKDLGYINDQKYLQILFEEYQDKNYGKKKIIQKLKMKGLDETTVGNLYFDEEKEIEKATLSLDKYVNSHANKSFNKLKNDSFAYLLNEGFESSIIAKVMLNLEDYQNYEDDVDILLKSLDKYVIMHQVDLNNPLQKEKIIKRYSSKGFAFKDIETCIKEILWKN